MSSCVHVRRSLAAAGIAVVSLVTCGAEALAAPAEPGSSSSASPRVAGSRIIGGREESNPWLVQLSFTDGRHWYGCSGEAIAPRWVLTARHCVEGVRKMNVYFSNDQHDRGPAYAADRLLPSPAGDVALVHLGQSAPIATFGRVGAYAPARGDRGTIEGYGLGADKTPTDTLRSAEVTILGSSRDAFGGQAIHLKGIDGGSNHGDSGGPLLINGTIVGVCSTGDTADPGSNIHATSNYANLTRSLNWINQTIGAGRN